VEHAIDQAQPSDHVAAAIGISVQLKYAIAELISALASAFLDRRQPPPGSPATCPVNSGGKMFEP
jgi:hypothetical protein